MNQPPSPRSPHGAIVTVPSDNAFFQGDAHEAVWAWRVREPAPEHQKVSDRTARLRAKPSTNASASARTRGTERTSLVHREIHRLRRKFIARSKTPERRISFGEQHGESRDALTTERAFEQ
jgi:hypothetical protein